MTSDWSVSRHMKPCKSVIDLKHVNFCWQTGYYYI